MGRRARSSSTSGRSGVPAGSSLTPEPGPAVASWPGRSHTACNVVGQTQAPPLYVEDQFNNFDLSAAYSAGLLLAVISVLIPDRDDLAHPQMPQGTRMSIQAAAISKSFGDFRAPSDVTVTTPPAI